MVQEYKVKVYRNMTEWHNLEGQLHRVDGPAVECSDGTKSWWINGQRHREDGPAFEWSNGSKAWYVNDQRHRVDGPAIERSNGVNQWWVNDELHRVDGPAIEFSDGTKEWWIEGKQLTEDEFNEKVNPIQELTVEEISKRLGYEIKVIKG